MSFECFFNWYDDNKALTKSINFQMDSLNVTKLDKGVAKCPFNPHANITTLMTENGRLFIGSPTDFSGTDPAILRADVAKVEKSHIIQLFIFFLHPRVSDFTFCRNQKLALYSCNS